MRVSSFSLLLFSALLLFSCSKKDKLDIPTVKNAEVVSVDVARQVALGFAARSFNQPGSRAGRQVTPLARRIQKEETIGETQSPYFHVFNFENEGGFVIVSAEQKEHPILAYSDKGSFKLENAPYGIVSWVETTKESIDNIREGKFDTEKKAYAEWGMVAKDYKIAQLAKLMPPEDPGCQEYSNTYTKGPLMNTTWGQGCGYNDLCPANTSGWRCGHFPTGCVATAMAQVMRYWQTPSSYNWASMPNNAGSYEVARLMRDAGSAVGMSYGDNGSGANHANIPGAMTGTFGFSSAQNISYGLSSYSTVQSQLNYNWPVILSGYNTKNTSWFGLVVEYQDGHEWVCDGYMTYDVFWCNPDGTGGGAGYLYFHMNWGWDGTANGWYGFDNWAPYNTGLNFQYYRRAIVNLHP